MTNLFSAKTSFANSIKDSNKKKSHTNFVSSSNLLENKDFKKFIDLYLNDTTEFYERLDGYDGYISTQQVESINYENFEEHVFFDSAVEKTNYAYDKAINYFPYDETSYSVQQYIKSLDGFTKFILDEKVEKNLNYMSFDGDIIIEVEDKKGSLLEDYEGGDTLNNFNPKQRTFSFDFWIYPKNQAANVVSCVFKKYSEASNSGFIIYLDNFNTTSETCNINFIVSDSSAFKFKRTLEISTEKFQHICFDVSDVIENDTISKKESIYIDGKKLSSNYLDNKLALNDNRISDLIINFSQPEFSQEKVYLGHSDRRKCSNITFNSGFVGHIDEFRFFIGQDRSSKDILKEMNENINARESLILYYRFNEPSGFYANNNVVLDFSGSKLHGIIKGVENLNQDFNVVNIVNYERNSIDVPVPLKYENIKLNPVLFSSFSQNSKEEILTAAREYDLINPNSFWKLFPKNIFLEGSDFDNVDEAYISESVKESSSMLGTKRSINHEIIKLISVWARFFDQIKIYIDSFSEILNFSYDSINKNKKIDGVVLPLALKQLGFNFKELYPLPIREKLENKNLSYEEVMSALSIRQIQNILWKRFILNSRDYLMSKGTKRSLKSVFNSFGLEADRFIRIRELTGQNNLNIKNQYESYFRNLRFIDFNRHSQIHNASIVDQNSKYYQNRIYASSGEIDNLEEWTYELYVKFDKNKIKMFENSQSIFRVDGRNNNIDIDYAKPIIDVRFDRLNNEVELGELSLMINENGEYKKEISEGVRLFNGCLYYCVLKKKLDAPGVYKYEFEISSTGNLSHIPSKKIIIDTDIDIFASVNKISFNIGEYNYEDYNTTSFQGSITQKRLYSTVLKEEVNNIKSKDIFFIGTGDISNIEETLLLNVDLSKNFSEIIDISAQNNKLIETTGDLLKINYILSDFNIEPFIRVGSLIATDNTVQLNNIIYLDYISSTRQSVDIDSVSNSNKVYINSFESSEYKKLHGNKNVSSTGQVNPDYLYHEDQRLYIDFSAVTFLNEDITKLITVSDYFTNMISNSSSLYEDRYVDLKEAREKYFKRLNANKSVNFEMLYQAYKYFDNVLEDLLYESIPSRVNYLGFNFVYESHILERNKYHHRNENSRLPLSSSDLLRHQKYDNTNVKYRYDDATGINVNAVIKKI